MTYARTSPIGAIESAAGTSQIGGMQVATRVAEEQVKFGAVALADLSCLRRCGLKGPSAAQWLQSQGIDVPAAANSWNAIAGEGVIARLGRSEFFLEDGARGDAAQRIKAALATGKDGAYPVIRQDAAFALLGPRSNELLAQTCNVNFQAVGEREAIMTQMAGVSVLAIRRGHEALPGLRLWCDPTFAPYLWETLVQIAAELGGGVVGSEGLLA
jgi:sarcosine oxidase subunit gamma